MYGSNKIFLLKGKLIISSQVLITESCVKGYSENFIHRSPIKQRAYTGTHYFYNLDLRMSDPNSEVHSQCKAYKIIFTDKQRS